MRLSNENEVKKWLRSICVIKQELKLKIEFYEDLKKSFGGLKKGQTAKSYDRIITNLKHRLDMVVRDTERLFSALDENERLIMTIKYLKRIPWDYIEFHVFYSRRQAIRIHNIAVKKLVGQEVGE